MFMAGAAGVAVLLALVAVVLAWRANGRANDALEKASAPIVVQPTTQPPTVTPPTTEPTTAPTGTETTTDGTEAPTLSPETKYAEKYTGEDLKVAMTDCSGSVDVDLDEPRVRAENTDREFTLISPCSGRGPRMELLDGVQGAAAKSDAVKPNECAELIRTGPLPAGVQALRTGQVYCINTSLDTARTKAITWKMIVLTVTATANDGTVTFKASAWDIPR
ncbi:hypothetical protein [Actinoplanes sp. NPDC026619]|uniref:hypothetical protein n=1 Tax=Actinoplanes sp. NPDC026619 TaxID=3155798 RepID=UPI0033DA7516